MTTDIQTHYSGSGELATQIRNTLAAAGKDVENLTSHDLAPVDEFHIRGRSATLELAERMRLTPDSHVLDIGSGIGGPARTVAETYGCRVTGIDLTPAFCEAAAEISDWLDLGDKVDIRQGDATDMPFADDEFDAAMTIHAAMNIEAKDAVYEGAKRVLKPGSIFAVYDVLQGEGGPVVFPVPWAREPSISHLATPDDMRRLLTDAGFNILDEIDSTEVGLAWFRDVTARMKESGPPPVTFQSFLGGSFPEMARNQVQNLADRRIRTLTYICQA
jgi:ubiquinone/menaquinone biosynthesis C-methylase UbiE